MGSTDSTVPGCGSAPGAADPHEVLRRWMDTRQLVTDGQVTGRVIGYAYRAESYGDAMAQVETPTGVAAWVDLQRLRPLPV